MIYKLKQNRVSRTYKGGSRIDKFTQEVFVKKGMYPEDWTASATAVKNSSGMTEGIGITENGEKITDIMHLIFQKTSTNYYQEQTSKEQGLSGTDSFRL